MFSDSIRNVFGGGLKEEVISQDYVKMWEDP